MSRATAAHRRARSTACPACERRAAISTVLNPGTVSLVCRWCDWESTTVIPDFSDGDA